MKDILKINESVKPKFPKHVRFRHNKARDEWVILAPERLVKLDPVAVEILKLVDGKVSVGEVSVAVAVSAIHRAEAFASASWLMERIKADVPVWKRQVNEFKSFWVHPEDNDTLARKAGRCSREPFDELS